VIVTVLIAAVTVAVFWSRADLGPGSRRAAVQRFARRSGLPADTVDEVAADRMVRLHEPATA
jgi:hypothetical protein